MMAQQDMPACQVVACQVQQLGQLHWIPGLACVLAPLLCVLNPKAVKVLFAGHRPPGLQIYQTVVAS